MGRHAVGQESPVPDTHRLSHALRRSQRPLRRVWAILYELQHAAGGDAGAVPHRDLRMSWQSIRGHDRVVDKFRRALAKGRLASTFLFVGPAGIGKRTFALKLAQALLCERAPEVRLEPCGACAT